MADILAGFPFWRLTFDKNGAPVNPDFLIQFRNEVKSGTISDLYIFSHGWNNDQETALRLYESFLGEVRKILSQTHPPSSVAIGTAGVIWPSILWPDNSSGDSGGAAGLSEPSTDLGSEMKKVFQEPSQQKAIDRLTDTLQRQSPTDTAVDGFIKDLKGLLSVQPPMPEYHDLEQRAAGATTDQWRQVFDGLADTEPGGSSEGGAAGLGDAFVRLWRGAKAALRVATYWQMKARAGVVGRIGLAPLLNQLSSRLRKNSIKTRVEP